MTFEREKRGESEDFENAVNSVEAVLFASGKPMSIEEISKICKISNDEVLKALEVLKKRYESGTSLTLIEYNNAWKLTVREKFIGKVRKIVPHTELTKTLLETLAVIAWKSPVLQSDIIKIRTNKAYEHINELAEQGFITKEKHGKTALLKLTKKFYDYFEIDETTDLSKILNKMQPHKKKPEVEFYGEKDNEAENKLKSEKKNAKNEKIKEVKSEEKRRGDSETPENSGEEGIKYKEEIQSKKEIQGENEIIEENDRLGIKEAEESDEKEENFLGVEQESEEDKTSDEEDEEDDEEEVK